jgi:uncharacterized low-complexity protein
MSKKNSIKPVAAAIGATLVGSLSVVGLANADENPFGASQFESGYMVLASNEEQGKCGEGKCGEGKSEEGTATKEGKCGEGKCGGDKDE